MIEQANDPFVFWLVHYGGIALFALLALGIIVLPVPEDTLVIFAGILINQKVLPIGSTFILACLGSICGITVSYFIGRTAGDFLIKKYGKYIGLTQERMEQVHWWFERFGRWVLFIGYFVPGLRHFTGLFAGISGYEYSHFALYAYTGAILWITALLSIGYFFGSCCESVIELIEDNVEFVLYAGAILFLAYLAFKIFKNIRKS